MDASAAKLIGAGLATIALAGVGVGIGNIFGSFVSGALRNPEAAPRVFGNVLLGFALTEAVALFALVIAFMILFVFWSTTMLRSIYGGARRPRRVGGERHGNGEGRVEAACRSSTITASHRSSSGSRSPSWRFTS